ncbi:MAG: glucose-6-phosphate isomerase [Magnetococcus sp. YQC-5]
MAFIVSPSFPVDRSDFHAAWNALQTHYEQTKNHTLQQLFADDPQRFQNFSRRFDGFLVDFSKNHLTSETLTRLLDLARAAGLETAREMLFTGGRINWTENTAALHVALRNRSGNPIEFNGQDVMPEVNAVLAKMQTFAENLRSGALTSTSGRKIRTVVHIGIGGSYLGPKMMIEALAPYTLPDAPEVRFLANIDGAEFVTCTRDLDPQETLFVVATKSFSTPETIINARTAWQWVHQAVSNETDVARHFVAVTANRAAAEAFGILPEAIFPIWEWLVGRYSWASAMSLPVVCRIGFAPFIQALEGAHAMDRHFLETPLEDNLPVLLAMISVLYNNFFDVQTHLVLPYSYHLRHFPAYYQQCEMESNGKSTLRDNTTTDHHTAQIIWGESGTNGQHSFFQLLHQGTRSFTADFIGLINPHHPLDTHHFELIANCFAQTEALMEGRNADEVRSKLLTAGMDPAVIEAILPQRVFNGNHPSNTLLVDRLTPYALGGLIALYEMKTFVQGVLWGVNSFDQWGVELGKELVKGIHAEQQALLAGEAADGGGRNPSTRGLLAHFAARYARPA